ncbi:hypothetical protein EJB05_57801, partial [Eragrostis curvula]
MLIPGDCSLVHSTKQQEATAAELEEKQNIKRIILEYNEREEEELNGGPLHAESSKIGRSQSRDFSVILHPRMSAMSKSSFAPSNCEEDSEASRNEPDRGQDRSNGIARQWLQQLTALRHFGSKLRVRRETSRRTPVESQGERISATSP